MEMETAIITFHALSWIKSKNKKRNFDGGEPGDLFRFKTIRNQFFADVVV